MKRFLVLVLIAISIISCGKANQSESGVNDNNSDRSLNPNSPFEYKDEIENVDDQLKDLESMLNEYLTNPVDIEKLRGIQTFVEKLKDKVEAIKLIEKLEDQFKDRVTPLSYLLSVYYLRANKLDKSIYFYKRNPFKDLNLEILENDIVVEYICFEKMFVELIKEKVEKNYTYINKEKLYKRDIKEFFKTEYPEVVINNYDSFTSIDLQGVNDEIFIEDTILTASTHIFIKGNTLKFNLNSGIELNGGASLSMEIGYLENGVFSSVNNLKPGKGKNGKSGRNATRSSNSVSGGAGENGANGIRGGDVMISSKISPNSQCKLKFCMSIIETNGGNGQDGGNGGSGGNGLEYKVIDTDGGDSRGTGNREKIVRRAQAGGGEGGVGGEGGSFGKITIQGSPFEINTLVIHSNKGAKGKSGTNGADGDMVRQQ